MTSFRQSLPPADQLSIFRHPASRDGDDRHLATTIIDAPENKVRSRLDVSNARLLNGLSVVRPYDIPAIRPCQFVPDKLIAFSEAIGMSSADADAWVHFYEHDYRFQRFWKAPEAYFSRLRKFAGIISPDFSLYRNMPCADKIHHTYRNQLLGARLQADGGNVIANVRLSGRASIAYALAGTPRQSTIALGLHGCIKDKVNRRHTVEEIRLICDALAPAHLVVYGSAAYGVLDYPQELGIPVHVFRPDTFTRSISREVAA